MNIKLYLINYLTKRLLKCVTEDDILQIVEGSYVYRRHNLSSDEITQLKEEAKLLSESFLWRLMVKELEYHAFMIMSTKAKTNNDIIFGKALFYSGFLYRRFLEGLVKRR